MKILVRNEEHVSECLLLSGTYLPREEILAHPQVQQFIGGRKIRHISFRPAQDVTIVDLDLARPR